MNKIFLEIIDVFVNIIVKLMNNNLNKKKKGFNINNLRQNV